eukprot:scaffold99618_cov39-Tisochrysis_lutea.AAC.1
MAETHIEMIHGRDGEVVGGLDASEQCDQGRAPVNNQGQVREQTKQEGEELNAGMRWGKRTRWYIEDERANPGHT